MEDKDKGEFRDFFLLDMPSFSNPVFESNSMSNPVPQNQQDKKNSALENMRFGKVYLRKKIVPQSVQVQVFNPDLENEVIISKPSLHGETESHVNNNDQDLPIAIRKGNRECTKQPLYPLAHFLSFKNFSPSHKAFLVSLNTISIPRTLFEALTNEKWKQAMNMEMEALEKKKTKLGSW